jgi:predicted phosphodiesterase
MTSPKRTLVIGDVHGCLTELNEMLARSGLGENDEIICVGDLVGKGPDSLGVLQWAMSDSRVRCVLGNHEARLLKAWQSGKAPREKASDAETFRQLGEHFDACMKFVNAWPLYIEDRDFLVVHAGLDPSVPELSQQNPEDLYNIRTLRDGLTPWYEEYRGEKLVLFGHWAKLHTVIRANAAGLDTGCVYGGSLTAMLLPERRLISVPAHRSYRAKKDWPTIEASP